MKQRKALFDVFEEITQKDNRYEIEAYNFVLLGLNYTMSTLDKPRHITGKELLEGIRVYALEQFGPMARTVLEHWGITCSEDIGEIVFNLVEHELLGKNQNDSKEDFRGVYDFHEAFDKPFKLFNS
ncbi:hypothetical protein KDK77_03450 [bacterium]|nr:hypothetical protein [bacterium]MCP5463278.1 hypothetical protein [bacterium]